MITKTQAPLITSDESLLLKQIQATHAPDGQFIDSQPLLRMVEEVFNLTMAEVDKIMLSREKGTSMATEVKPSMEMEGTAATEQEEPQETSGSSLETDMLHSIERLSIEVAAHFGADSHSKTISILNTLSGYSWETKLMLMLYVVALKYGKFVLLIEVYLSNKLPKPMAILKGMADIHGHLSKLEPLFSQLNDLIKKMLDLAKCIVEFTKVLSLSSLLDGRASSVDIDKASSIAIDDISLATYWNIRTALVCAARVAQVNSLGLECITSREELWELTSLAHKIGKLTEQLHNQLPHICKHIEEKKQRNAYEDLVLIIGMQHKTNLDVLKDLLCAREEDEPALYDGSNKKMVNLDVLRKKNVLLLISGFNISNQDPDLVLLHHLYKESRMKGTPVEAHYELVWVPVLEPGEKWTSEMETTLEKNRSTMPWYTLNKPNEIKQPVISLFRKKFNYQGQAIAVVLDPLGMVVNTDAIDMMWIWGNYAFPFSRTVEENLWKGEILGLELIVDGLHPEIENWVKEGKYTVIYGGDNVEWFHKFIETIDQVRKKSNIPLEILYVGKSNQKEQEMNTFIKLIKKEALGHYYLPDVHIMWIFWNRLEHMKRSKIRMESGTVGEDPILQGVNKLLSYDQSGRWASLFKGKEVVVTGHGDAMLSSMQRYLDGWEENTRSEFDVAFKEYFNSPHIIDIPTLQIILPSSFESTIASGTTVLCPECNRNMEKHILLRCTHGMQ